jgi:hypothetical protein
MSYPRVILISGAPMSGKTTVAHRLAAILGYGCLSTDDLGEAIRAVTTKDSHPHLHPMEGYDYREYYVTRSPDALIADVSREHRALWPAVERVIRTHATWGGAAGYSHRVASHWPTLKGRNRSLGGPAFLLNGRPGLTSPTPVGNSPASSLCSTPHTPASSLASNAREIFESARSASPALRAWWPQSAGGDADTRVS